MDAHPSPKKQWELTQEAFDRFLAALDPDRERAGEKYEQLRVKLVKLFEWERCLFPEEYADETINRAARRLESGEVIRDVNSYCTGVMRFIAKELWKGPDAKRVDIEGLEPVYEWLKKLERQIEEERLYKCFQECLRQLSEDKLRLIIEFFEGEKRDKITRRQRLADTLGITRETLGTRAARIRKDIKDCLSNSLKVEII